MRTRRVLALLALLGACASPPPAPTPDSTPPRAATVQNAQANEVVLFALGLLDTGYKFGGRNPEAGLDCSGMVSYVVQNTLGRKLPHNAAQIAGMTRNIRREELQPADLVFFNTNGKPYSHMGIYMGDGKFVHAPSTNGRVRVERMDNSYFAARFVGARSLFD